MSLEGTQQLLVQRFIEIVGDDESAFVDSKYRAFVFHRHKTCHGPSRAGNDDILSEDDLPQQPGEMRLRFVNADLAHDDRNLD